MHITYPDGLKCQLLAPSSRDCPFGFTKLVVLTIQ